MIDGRAKARGGAGKAEKSAWVRGSLLGRQMGKRPLDLGPGANEWANESIAGRSQAKGGAHLDCAALNCPAHRWSPMDQRGPARAGCQQGSVGVREEANAPSQVSRVMRAVCEELKLEVVYTEQGASGAATLPTTLLCTPNASHSQGGLNRLASSFYRPIELARSC